MRKSVVVPVNVTHDEKASIIKLAEESDLSVSEYCRQKVLGTDKPLGQRRPKRPTLVERFNGIVGDIPLPVGGTCLRNDIGYDWCNPNHVNMCVSLCLSCPALEACKTFLQANRDAGLHVEGVIAGIQPTLTAEERREARQTRIQYGY